MRARIALARRAVIVGARAALIRAEAVKPFRGVERFIIHTLIGSLRAIKLPEGVHRAT